MLVLLLALLCLSGLVQGQSHALVDVTAQQFPEGLPKLTDGAQAWGDYDKDGRADLLIMGKTAPGQSITGFITRLYRNTASGFVEINVGYPQMAFGTVNWVDYDGDGWLDFMLTGYTGTKSVRVLAHNVGGGFEDASSLIADVPALSHSAVSWADYNGDGKPDVVVSGQTDNQGAFSQLYLQTTSGFEKANAFWVLPRISNGSFSSADFNRDGRPDLLLTGYTGAETKTPRISRLYLTTPSGFVDASDKVPGLPGVDRSSVGVGDYDLDGWPDVMLTGSSELGPISKLYHNLKSQWNNFELVPTGLPGVKSSALDWGDYDRDGRPDLVITGQRFQTAANGSTTLVPFGGVYHNTVNGFVDVTREKTYGYLPQVTGGMVAWGDPNKDGRLELVVAGDQGQGVKSYVRSHFSTSNPNPDDPRWLVTTFMSKGSGISPRIIADLLLSVFGFFFNPLAAIPPLVDGIIQLSTPGVVQPDYSGPLAYGSAQFVDDPNGLGTGSLFLTGYSYTDENGEDEQYSKLAGRQFLTTYNSPNPSSEKMLESLPSVGLSASDWADFDHDGKLDVAIIGRGGIGSYNVPYVDVAWVRLQPNGQAIPLPGNPTLHSGTVDWGDYDGDGWADLLITGRDVGRSSADYKDYSYYTFLYHNEQGKGFTDATRLLPNVSGLAYSAAAWGDYDNDGRLDLMLTGESSTEPVSHLYHNTGAGFEELSNLLPNLPGLNTGTVHWVDYDHDGLLDLFITGDSYHGPVALLYRNKGLKSLFEETTGQLPNLPGLTNGTADWTDFDKDGRLDLLLTGQTDAGQAVTKFYQNTAGGFADISAQMPGLPAVSASAAAWGDYDGDGYADLLLTGGSGAGGPVSRLFHNTRTDVSTLLPDLPQLSNSSIAWGDYDNDGRPDLLLTGTTSNLTGVGRLYHNTGTGFEDQSSRLPAMPQPGFGSVAWGDYDNDGLLDLIITGSRTLVTGVSKLYHNTGSGFEDVSSLVAGLPQVRYSAVAWGDYDNDGKLDLIITGQSGSTGVSKLYRNTGSGFEDASVLLPGLPQVHYSAVAWGDYDNDGKLDLLITGRSGSTSISKLYHNTGSGFENVSNHIALPQVGYSSIAWGDYDNDGKLDLLITGRSGSTSISKLYHNTGSGFEDRSGVLPGLPQVENGAAAWGDVDNNGWLDLVITGSVGSNAVSKVYLGNPAGFRDVTKALTSFSQQASGSAAFADLNNDGRLDLMLSGIDGCHLYDNAFFAAVNPVPVNTVPTAPTGLTSTPSAADGSVTLSWQKATDAQTLSLGLTYNLYVSDKPGGQNVADPMADQSSGYRRVVRLGNSQSLSYLLTGLKPGTQYYWSVQAIDGAFAGGKFAAEQSFVTNLQGPLAIVLGNITATNQGDRNRIEWNTLYEDLGDYFEIEKSTNGSEFSTLSKLNARGSASAYTIYDEKPVEGMNYYRLKIYHKSGGFNISKIVSVFRLHTDAFAIEAFPNPVKDRLTINIHGLISGKANISVINGTGSKVLQSNVTQSPVTLDLSKLPKGIYVVKYADGKKTETMKIIRQ